MLGSVRNNVHHGKREVYSGWTNTRNVIAFRPGKVIGTLPSKGLTKGRPDHYDCCHLSVRPLDGNVVVVWKTRKTRKRAKLGKPVIMNYYNNYHIVPDSE